MPIRINRGEVVFLNVHFQRLFCLFVVGVLLVLPVCAAGPDQSALDETAGVVVEAPAPVVVQAAPIDDLIQALVEAVAGFVYQGELEEVSVISVPMEDSDFGVAPFFDLDDGQTSEPSGTLKSILVKLIGPYNPVIVQYRYQTNTSGSYSYLREIQPDYVWFASAGLFALMVFCTFRLGGVLLRKI